MELNRPRILLVDDDELMLDALQRQLRQSFDVTVATEGKLALKLAVTERPFAVVVSDLRMPGMDGVSVLYCMWQAAPDTVRVLLTGSADIESVVAAVNQAKIFRLLTKPCPPHMLIRALQDSVEQHRRVMADRGADGKPSIAAPSE
jgi:DNA-binding NtrC family response regulator